MLKQIARLRVGLVISLGILLFYSSAFAMADRVVISRGGNRMEERHYYRDGRWYKHDSRGNQITVDVLPIGVFIESLPPRYTTVVVEGNSYYHDDRYYYRQSPKGGYVVVPEPVIVRSQPQSNHGERGQRHAN